MSDKQKQPLPENTDNQKAQQQNQTGRRGIEPEEQHRQGGHRVPDQGNRKSGGDKR